MLHDRREPRILRDHAVDEFDHPGAVIASEHDVHLVPERRESIGNGRGAAAAGQERVVVLGIADADHVMSREVEVGEGGP